MIGIRDLPKGKNSILGFYKPLFFNNKTKQGFYLRYYNEHVKDCLNLDNFYQLNHLSLFKNEILLGKKISKDIKYEFLSEHDCVLPITGTKETDQEINLSSDGSNSQLNLISQRYTY